MYKLRAGIFPLGYCASIVRYNHCRRKEGITVFSLKASIRNRNIPSTTFTTYLKSLKIEKLWFALKSLYML